MNINSISVSFHPVKDDLSTSINFQFENIVYYNGDPREWGNDVSSLNMSATLMTNASLRSQFFSRSSKVPQSSSYTVIVVLIFCSSRLVRLVV